MAQSPILLQLGALLRQRLSTFWCQGSTNACRCVPGFPHAPIPCRACVLVCVCVRVSCPPCLCVCLALLANTCLAPSIHVGKTVVSLKRWLTQKSAPSPLLIYGMSFLPLLRMLYVHHAPLSIVCQLRTGMTQRK